MEVKFDGEHLLLHKYEKTKYKYYTRNGIDYTNKLGGESDTKLSAKIHNQFLKSVKDCILDCELLIWDKQGQSFGNIFIFKIKFLVGKNRRSSDGNIYDAKHLNEDFFNNSNFERCVAVFDILFFNGKSLTNMKLSDRVLILDKKILSNQDKSKIFISEKTLVQTS